MSGPTLEPWRRQFRHQVAEVYRKLPASEQGEARRMVAFAEAVAEEMGPVLRADGFQERPNDPAEFAAAQYVAYLMTLASTYAACKPIADAGFAAPVVLDRMEERRGELRLTMDAGASLRDRVEHIVEALWAGLDTRDAQAFEGLRASLPHDRAELEAHYPQTAAALASWHDGWQRACAEAFAGLDLDRATVAEVAAYLPGAMRGLNSERNLSTYTDMDRARRGLVAAVVAHLAS